MNNRLDVVQIDARLIYSLQLLSNPVNVAHCPPTDARGAAYRISRITSPFSFSSEEEPAGLESRGKRRENSSGTAGAVVVPVSTA